MIHISHSQPDIAYAIVIVSCYMQKQRSTHLEAIHRILRHLKSSPGKGLLLKRTVTLE